MRAVSPAATGAARVVSQTFVELTFTLAAHFHGVVPQPRYGEQVGREFLREQVKDPEVRRKLTPEYALGCKRPGFSNEYLGTFNRDNVLLETTPIDAIIDGVAGSRPARAHQDLDVLMLATGFKVFEQGNMPPYPVQRAGRRRPRAVVGREPLPGLRGRERAGLPEPVLDPRAVRLQRLVVLPPDRDQSRHIMRCLKRAR